MVFSHKAIVYYHFHVLNFLNFGLKQRREKLLQSAQSGLFHINNSLSRFGHKCLQQMCYLISPQGSTYTHKHAVKVHSQYDASNLLYRTHVVFYGRGIFSSLIIHFRYVCRYVRLTAMESSEEELNLIMLLCTRSFKKKDRERKRRTWVPLRKQKGEFHNLLL